MPRRYLVIGGAGRTGSLVVRALLAAGAEVVVMSRRPNGAPAGADLVTGDIRDRDRVTRALDGVAGVVISVEPPADGTAADEVAHQAVATIAALAQAGSSHVVLISQIYITRPDAFPYMRDIIVARGRGEEALRASGAPYTIVRPSWLTDRAPGEAGIRVEQGDRSDGEISRGDVALVCARALEHAAARGKTFELYNEPGHPPGDWAAVFAHLLPDSPAGR